ncbi:unnamed protein product [Symbiodinium microadriaticum]|nr:unnamed protein product [Symbiodinium microadriaticum]
MGVSDRATLPIVAHLLDLPYDAPGCRVESLVKPELVDWQLEPRHATKVLSRLARAGRVRLCRQVLQAMRRGQVQTNVFHYSAEISACELTSAWDAALDMVKCLQSYSFQGVRPRSIREPP